MSSKSEKRNFMIPYTRPPAVGPVKNYTILRLDGEPHEIRERWLNSIKDLRSWCYNSTDSRYMFGSDFHKCAKVPESGYFFIYLLLNGQCICLVIEGSTLYLVGFITSSVGDADNLGVWEMSITENEVQVQYIQRSKKIKGWFGNYKDAQNVQVGGASLRSAFHGMYKYCSGALPQPSQKQVHRWCDTFVIHFPEAGRFDSLALCNIYRRFDCGGCVGSRQVDKAQNWSSDCRGSLAHMKLVEMPETEGKNQTIKRKGEAPVKKHTVKKQPEAHVKKNVKVFEKDIKHPRDMSRVEVEITIKDIRLFHRSNPAHTTCCLSSLPFQVDNGAIVGVPPLDLDGEAKSMEFLVKPVHGFSHEACGLTNGIWECKGWDKNQKEHGIGLYNMGNTCYINSTMQFLRSVSELKSSLQMFSSSGSGQTSDKFTVAIRDLFIELEESSHAVVPTVFLQALHKKFPHCALKINNGYIQQDAVDFWSDLMCTLSETLTSKSSESAALPVRDLFEIDFVNRVHCAESGEESLEGPESAYVLPCHISEDVSNIYEGVKHGLMTKFEEKSPAGQLAIYTRASRINKLPRYLTVKLERLIWKRESNQQAKNSRKVEYPLELDLFEFCSDELKQSLHAPRRMLTDAGNAELRLEGYGKACTSKGNEEVSISAGEESSMDIDLK